MTARGSRVAARDKGIMPDTVTIAALAGLAVFGFLWSRASSEAWYYDSDNDPVSPRAVFGLLWMVCLFILILQFF